MPAQYLIQFWCDITGSIRDIYEELMSKIHALQSTSLFLLRISSMVLKGPSFPKFLYLWGKLQYKK